MQIRQDQLIKELLTITEQAMATAQQFKTLSRDQLNFKKSSAEWSILECLEHLNLYGDFYLPEIENQLLKNTINRENLIFKSGLIGNYFVNTIQVKNGKIKKMNSPKDKIPSNSDLSIITIDRFSKQLEKLRLLLHQSATVDLTKLKTAISLTPLIKLRLGDTCRFLVYHIERHMQQAQRNIIE